MFISFLCLTLLLSLESEFVSGFAFAEKATFPHELPCCKPSSLGTVVGLLFSLFAASFSSLVLSLVLDDVFCDDEEVSLLLLPRRVALSDGESLIVTPLTSDLGLVTELTIS